jgi:hypothetical protein
MTQYTIYIGLCVGTTGAVVPKTTEARIIRALDRLFGGLAIARTTGYYRGGAEPSLMVVAVSDTPYDRVRRVVRAICRVAGQDCVLVTRVPVTAEFIAGT